MRKTLLCILVCLVAFAPLVAQSLLDRQVSFVCNKTTVSDALVELTNQTQINITFLNEMFENCPAIECEDYYNTPVKKIIRKLIACNDRLDFRVTGPNNISIFKRKEKSVLNGKVKDNATHEVLIGASVKVIRGNEIYCAAITDAYGFFTLEVPPGYYDIVFNYIGYHTDTVRQVPLNAGLYLPHTMFPVDMDLEEVLIDMATTLHHSPNTYAPDPAVGIKQMKERANPLGGSDPLRALNQLPGVQSGSDGIGGLYVRGGNSDQNLILLDDVPVYNPNHALGMYSIFNTNTLNQVRFWKGDFPARYGSRASSVIDLRTRDGNMKDHNATISSDLFASSVVVEGPFKEEKSSFLAAFRCTYFGPWISRINSDQDKAVLNFTKNKIGYYFYDANVKINHIINKRHRLYGSFYTGEDDFNGEFNQKNKGVAPGTEYSNTFNLTTDWGNSIASLRHNWIIKDNSTVNTTVRYSEFKYNNVLSRTSYYTGTNNRKELVADIGTFYRSQIRDWSVKSDATVKVNNQLSVHAGGSSTWHQFRPGTLSINFELPGQGNNIDSLRNILKNNTIIKIPEVELYADAEIQLPRHFTLTTGMNFSIFMIKQQNNPVFLPRVNLVYHHKGLGFWGSFCAMGQNLHQIGSYSAGLPFELWVPTTQRMSPSLVNQWTGGASYNIKKWDIKSEVYHKNLKTIWTLLTSDEVLLTGGAEDAEGWQDRMIRGHGNSKGVELTIARNGYWNAFSVAGAWSKTNRQFDQINQGITFPFRFDRRYDLKASITQRVFKHLDINVTWAFATGNPITLATIEYTHKVPDSDLPPKEVYVYKDVNGYRLPNSHRLDAALNFHFGDKKRLQHSIHAGVYNAYNRNNPFFIVIDAEAKASGKATQYTLLPTMPVFRYELKIR